MKYITAISMPYVNQILVTTLLIPDLNRKLN